ncbi:hypothetical protein BD769DRAFT_1382947 [Suillus cothurnatus]|nr:hypothetical protein BD769DRAFT_1382947 [Suillus cothurnatus]
MQEDPEADEDAEYQDAEGNVHMTDEQGNLEMLVGIVETANSNKPIKTEAGQLPWACNIKKEKLKNVHLPIVHGTWNGAQNSFQWSLYKQLGNFEVDGSDGSFNVKAYLENQLEDSCFIYEDPDSEDSPGAFLSEFILCIFAAHLNAIQGHQFIDTLNVALPGYQTALALTTATFILARDDLIIEDTSDHGKHKIVLTLNQATNKMSNTSTAFSAGNWETDTLAYMEQSQPYMKHPHHKSQDKDTVINSESHVPVNP